MEHNKLHILKYQNVHQALKELNEYKRWTLQNLQALSQQAVSPATLTSTQKTQAEKNLSKLAADSSALGSQKSTSTPVQPGQDKNVLLEFLIHNKHVMIITFLVLSAVILFMIMKCCGFSKKAKKNAAIIDERAEEKRKHHIINAQKPINLKNDRSSMSKMFASPNTLEKYEESSETVEF